MQYNRKPIINRRYLRILRSLNLDRPASDALHMVSTQESCVCVFSGDVLVQVQLFALESEHHEMLTHVSVCLQSMLWLFIPNIRCTSIQKT